MGILVYPIVLSVLVLGLLHTHFVKAQQNFEFTIKTTWNGEPLEDKQHINITLTSGTQGGLRVFISAPFFNDSQKPSASYLGSYDNLWKHEVVELFFLNEEDKYLELEFSPFGYYWVLLLNGYRNTVLTSLPLQYSADIKSDNETWMGVAEIPKEYFPANVTKFNAYAIHWSKPKESYYSLYPVDTSVKNPDFHLLKFFKEVDVPVFDNSKESTIWQTAITASIKQPTCPGAVILGEKLVINKAFNGSKLPDTEHINIQLNPGDQGGLEAIIDAPLFNDSKPVSGIVGSYKELHEHEVVGISLLNEQNQYLELLFSPFGYYSVVLLNGYRNQILRELPLEYSASISEDGRRWRGRAIIPKQYLPRRVSRINAYGIHDTSYYSLYSADSTLQQPDAHALEFFGKIDISPLEIDKESNIWKTAIKASENKAKTECL